MEKPVKPSEVCCPHCQSKKVRSTDNEPLYHPRPEDIAQYPNGGALGQLPTGISNLYGVDEEVYIDMVCDECLKTFKIMGVITEIRYK